jgi:acetyl esterase/lipase
MFFKGLKVSSHIDFVHGGYWNSGRKGTYDLLGRILLERCRYRYS